MTQVDRIIAALEDHPGMSSWELTLATGSVNVTGRISEIRRLLAPSRTIECARVEGVYRYRLVLLHPVQGELFEMAS